MEQLSRDDFKVIQVVGEPPEQVKPGWLVFNAPRPLAATPPYNENTWIEDFVHGVFYAQIDPAEPYAQQRLRENKGLDSWLVEWIGQERHRENVNAAVAKRIARGYLKPEAVTGAKITRIDEAYRGWVNREEHGVDVVIGPLLKD